MIRGEEGTETERGERKKKKGSCVLGSKWELVRSGNGVVVSSCHCISANRPEPNKEGWEDRARSTSDEDTRHHCAMRLYTMPLTRLQEDMHYKILTCGLYLKPCFIFILF